jgi:hypothetical protein
MTVRSLGSVALRLGQSLRHNFHFNFFALDLNEVCSSLLPVYFIVFSRERRLSNLLVYLPVNNIVTLLNVERAPHTFEFLYIC